jgi:leader peptidase (prepilin peptidase)/N-methyltransferase
MIYIIILILGLLLGSFFNVCIYRIPRDQSIVFPPSHCTSCNHSLAWIDLFPVLSYIFLGGRCRYCKTRISSQYPVVELLTAGVFLIIYNHFGLGWTFVQYCILFSILIIVAFIDQEHQIIPDLLVIIGIVTGAIFIVAGISVSWWDGLIGMLVGGGIFWIIAVLSEAILKKEGMGGGDIKLMAMIGLTLGWKYTLLSILLSIYTGGIIGSILLYLRKKKRGDHIAFGPFIAIGSFIAAIYGKQLLYWYGSLFLGL